MPSVCPVCRSVHRFDQRCDNPAPWAHSMGSGPLMRADGCDPMPPTLGVYVAMIRAAYGNLRGVRLWAIQGGLWIRIDQLGRALYRADGLLGRNGAGWIEHRLGQDIKGVRPAALGRYDLGDAFRPAP